jgi:ProQ/FINO family
MIERKTLRATPAMRGALGIEPEPPPAPVMAAPPPAPAVRQALPGRTAQSARARERHATNLRISALLAERFPEAFRKPRPLAIGIYRQIRAAVPNDELRSKDLSAFMAAWTHRKAYRAALERGERRVNLDGSDAGPAFTEQAA